MNIKVITRHAPSNYGSLLQAIATQTVLERLGHGCEIIDYRRLDEMGFNIIRSHLNNLKDWSRNPLKKLLYIALRYPEEFIAEKRFRSMQKKHLRLTKAFHSLDELKALRADVFMTGSDQVWGPTLSGVYDEAYFLAFAGHNDKKVAYAASFGRTGFTDAELSKYKALLSGYSAITVREDSAVGLLEKIGVGCKGQVLDPTLLLDKDDWGGFIKSRRKGGYILAYQLNNAKVSDCARQLSIESGLPLVRVTPYFHQVVEGGKMVLLPSVGDFLSCIRDCSYLVTDSFHGTAFAINFNKQFMAVLPEGSTNTRNLSLLKLFGLERRAVSGTAIGGLAEGSIDYSLVNEMLEEQRRISIAALNNMLK